MIQLSQYSSLIKIKAQQGMTLIELLIIIAILGVLSSLANSMYTSYIETARVNNAITQIAALSLLIDDYILENGSPPSTLSQIGTSNLIDPWGRPYQYLQINVQESGRGGGGRSGSADDDNSPGGSVTGKARKDRNLVPLNTDYDLYSNGSDGLSRPPLPAPVSQDDVLRANNGNFIALASTY